ncbi:MAG: hypothetical protein HKN29_16875, partial [Rhodothermales bacterium]|nr:hypothetical protein [Rhodothermales bacterium]
MAAAVVSCTAPIAEPSPQEAQSIEPARIEAHYGRLNSAETGGRRTATIGYAAAATYVAERLAGFGIQPIHPGEYRHLSYGPINHVRGMTLRVLDADSTTWGNDAFMLPDPRTSSGRLVLRSFRKLASGQPIPPGLPGTVAVTDFVPSDSLAVAVAAAGYP